MNSWHRGPIDMCAIRCTRAEILACFGSAIVAGGVFVFLLLVLTPLFLWRVRAEDELLARQFPQKFPAYKRRTKALIPFVW